MYYVFVLSLYYLCVVFYLGRWAIVCMDEARACDPTFFWPVYLTRLEDPKAKSLKVKGRDSKGEGAE